MFMKDLFVGINKTKQISETMRHEKLAYFTSTPWYSA